MTKIIIILSLFISITTSTAAITTYRPHNKVYNHILRNNPNLDPTYIEALSKAVYGYSKKYSLDPIRVSAILRQECNYKLDCVNIASKDYSLGQINIKTIKAFRFNKKRLMRDINYSVEATTIVLADFKRMFGHEKDWYCRYNVGTGNRALIKDKCNTYKRLVARYL